MRICGGSGTHALTVTLVLALSFPPSLLTVKRTVRAPGESNLVRYVASSPPLLPPLHEYDVGLPPLSRAVQAIASPTRDDDGEQLSLSI